MNNELENLRKKILKFNEAYEKGEPLIEDFVYDFYKKKLKILESNEKFKVSDYVGINNVYQKSKHLFPILSLEHDFNSSAIEKFLIKIQKYTDPFPLIAELKIDGVSVIAEYKNGLIQKLKTRGNGIYGEDVSDLINFVNIPNQIYLKEHLEIRFEAYFEKEKFKNPRNAAAGILLKKTIDQNLTYLKFAPHNLYSHAKIWNSYQELREIFTKMHLETIAPYSVCYSLKDCIDYFYKIEQEKDTLNHEIDGIVFKINEKHKQELLGNTARSPKFAFAIKFSNSFNITEITNIKFQVGRQGNITPLAILTETDINNRKINKATLNNLNYLAEKQYSIGDIVQIEMAGEVIPKITKIIEKSNNTCFIPTQCPSCLKKLENNTCNNGWNCYEQKLNRLIYFASKEALNIKNLGNSQIDFFIKKNILNFPYDFFEIKNNINKITTIPAWLANKNYIKLIENIEKSKFTSLEAFISSIGLPNIAKNKAKEIAEYFKTFDNFINATEDMLKFLGENNAKNIYYYKETEKNWILKTFSYLHINEQYVEYSLFNF